MKEFAGNPDVKFADINLATDRIIDDFNPGQGGWPTIRYFNKKTGYRGQHYRQKTDKPVCDELKQRKYMKAYVEEAGNTLLCNVSTKAGCADGESTYIDKWSAKTPEEIETEMGKLKEKSSATKTAKRVALLERIAKVVSGEGAGKEEL